MPRQATSCRRMLFSCLFFPALSLFSFVSLHCRESNPILNSNAQGKERQDGSELRETAIEAKDGALQKAQELNHQAEVLGQRLYQLRSTVADQSSGRSATKSARQELALRERMAENLGIRFRGRTDPGEFEHCLSEGQKSLEDGDWRAARLSFENAQRIIDGTLSRVNAYEDAILLVLQEQDETGSAIHKATASGNPLVVQALIELGESVDQPDSEGRTPLIVACDSASWEVAMTLLSHGADVRKSNADGLTPLHLVARAGNVEMARLAVAAGADPKVRSVSGKTALDFASDPAMKVFLSDCLSGSGNGSEKNGVGNTLKGPANSDKAETMDSGPGSTEQSATGGS